jgi:hypothetical protein
MVTEFRVSESLPEVLSIVEKVRQKRAPPNCPSADIVEGIGGDHCLCPLTHCELKSQQYAAEGIKSRSAVSVSGLLVLSSETEACCPNV